MQIITRLFRFDLAHKQLAEVIEKETVHLGLQFTHHLSPPAVRRFDTASYPGAPEEEAGFDILLPFSVSLFFPGGSKRQG